jgi:hypothetical protein
MAKIRGKVVDSLVLRSLRGAAAMLEVALNDSRSPTAEEYVAAAQALQMVASALNDYLRTAEACGVPRWVCNLLAAYEREVLRRAARYHDWACK